MSGLPRWVLPGGSQEEIPKAERGSLPHRTEHSALHPAAGSSGAQEPPRWLGAAGSACAWSQTSGWRPSSALMPPLSLSFLTWTQSCLHCCFEVKCTNLGSGCALRGCEGVCSWDPSQFCTPLDVKLISLVQCRGAEHYLTFPKSPALPPCPPPSQPWAPDPCPSTPGCLPEI